MRKWWSILFFLYAFTSYSQEYSFLNYSIENGLPQSQISSFAQDNEGYLWIGTMGGLAQYNGQSFVTYTIKNKLLKNRITSLDFQKDSILIGHEGGISIRFQQKFTTFAFQNEFSNAVVSKIISYKGKVYVFTNGDGYFILENGKLTAHSLATSDQNRIRGAVIFQNQLFIATRGGILSCTNGNQFQLIPETEKFNASGLSIYNNQQLVFSTFNSELIFFNPASGKKKQISLNENIYGLRNCYVSSKKEIWVPHLEGIIRVDAKFNVEYINQESGLNYENINTIFEDNNQTIWIGSEGKGIYKFSGNHIRIFRFQKESKSGIILSTCMTKQSHIYGTYEGNLIFQNENQKNNENITTDLGAIWAISKTAEKHFLLGTQEGLFHYHTNSNKPTPILYQSESLGKITTIHQVNDTHYIGGDFGLAIYKNQHLTAVFETPGTSTIRSIVSHQQQLYIGADNGLFTFKNGKFQQAFNFNTKINALFYDTANRLWIGTDEGLFLLEKNTIHQIGISKNAAADLINFINADKNNIIIGTNDGIYYSKLNSNLKTFKHIGLEEGISNLETNINSSSINSQGEVVFGTALGVNFLNLSTYEAKKTAHPPMVVLKNIDINFRSLHEYAKELKIEYDQHQLISSIELPHNRNNILLTIDGISLNNHSSLTYQYRIIGLEEEWSPKFSNPQINLTNLSSGKYEIQIRAVNEENLFSPTLNLSVVIHPPFYLTAWFISLASFLLILLIYTIVKLRLNQIHKNNLRDKMTLEGRLSQLEQQSLNASMNRHFIFNSLNSIQYYINTQDKYAANKYLSDFAKLIRKNLDASSGQNNVVLLSEEIERLKLYLSLELMRFQGRFTYEIDESDVITEHYYVPPMLLQPFVENSIVHGILPNQEKVGLIQITIQDFMSHLEIRIKDNGIGITKSMEAKNQNLHKDDTVHISKGVELSAKRIELLKEFYGNEFELIGPFQTKDENGLISGTTVLIKIPKQNLAD